MLAIVMLVCAWLFAGGGSRCLVCSAGGALICEFLICWRVPLVDAGRVPRVFGMPRECCL